MSAPKAILVGGANGAGKTTLARQYLPLLYPGILFLNADEIQHATDEPLSSIAAGKELLRRQAGILFLKRQSADGINAVWSCSWNLIARFSIYGTIGSLMNRDSNSSPPKPRVTEDLELVLEAARRANWDAQHGPEHLRSGRFFISELHKAHAWKPTGSTLKASISKERETSRSDAP